MKQFIASFLTLLSLNAFSGVDPKLTYEQVEKGDAVLIDVREADEIKSGMIKKAHWFPMSKFTSGSEWKTEFQKMTEGKKISLYCRSGNRSGKVKEILKQNGIETENLGGYQTLKDILPTEVPANK